MNKWIGSRIFWGILLILCGMFFLFQNLGFIKFNVIFWALIFGSGGLYFIIIYLRNRENWWGLIPGFAMLSIALLITVGEFVPDFTEKFGGVVFLGGVGVSFLVVYLIDQANWWAVIPAGVMLTLALVSGLESILPGDLSGSLFFFGLGLTFGAVALIPTPRGKMKWAWIPAGVLLLLGIFTTGVAGTLFGFIWPFALIILGIVFIYRTIKDSRY